MIKWVVDLLKIKVKINSKKCLKVLELKKLVCYNTKRVVITPCFTNKCKPEDQEEV